jgi:formylglycine-generating enzyme required for sulfatase activity
MKRLVVFLLGFTAWTALANNIIVTNVTVLNAAGGVADIRFDLSWDNSWHSTWAESGGAITMTNWDAAWVFVKFRSAGGHWLHAILNASGHVVTGGTQIGLGTNKLGQPVGAFVYRVADGNGTLTCNAMSLKWNYAATGLGGTNAVDISVHAIEMVYIPQGPFYVGSGGTEFNAFYAGTNPAQPYQITNEAAITVGTNGLNYPVNNPGTPTGDLQGPIPAAYPKGYNAFYVMKYEISQGQYAEFLNFIDPGLAATRYLNAYGSSRNTLTQTGLVYSASAPDRGCNFLTWKDLITCLKWAALRPMDELEFEKACRGPLYPVPNEFAWGDTLGTPLTGFNGVDGSGTETATPTNANGTFNNQITGPVRVGIFATAASGRHEAGAGYYGAMNLADNVSEWVVNVGTTDGRAFTAEPGDGNELTPASTWPDVTNIGMGTRGGFFGDNGARNRTSDRYFAHYHFEVQRNPQVGGRGVRTAP